MGWAAGEASFGRGDCADAGGATPRGRRRREGGVDDAGDMAGKEDNVVPAGGVRDGGTFEGRRFPRYRFSVRKRNRVDRLDFGMAIPRVIETGCDSLAFECF